MAYNSYKGLIAMSVVLQVLSLVAVGLRFVARKTKRLPFLVDDWLILAAMVFVSVLTALEIYGCVTKGFGVPFYETFTTDPVGSEERVLMAKKVLVALSSIAPTALCLIKTSIACLYRRIFSIRPYRILINIWLVVLVAWAIGITIATLLECGTNLWAVVSPNIQEYLTYCTRTLSIGIAYCSTDVATDVITVILPLPMIWRLQMPMRQKLSVGGIFLVALMSVTASIVRLVVSVQEIQSENSVDPITSSTALAVWTLVEAHTGIIAACLPTLRPIVSSLRTQSSLSRIIGIISTRRQTSDPLPSSSAGRAHRLSPYNTREATSQNRAKNYDVQGRSSTSSGHEHLNTERPQTGSSKPESSAAPNWPLTEEMAVPSLAGGGNAYDGDLEAQDNGGSWRQH